MHFDALNREPIQPIHNADGDNAPYGRDAYNPGSIKYGGDVPDPDLKTEKEKHKTKASAAAPEKGEEDERDDLLQLVDHPEFSLLLALLFDQNDVQIDEIRRLIREQRGIDEWLTYPGFSMSYILYQAKRLESYLSTLYYYADYPGQKLSRFI